MNLRLVKSQIIRNIFSFRFLFVIIIGYVLTYIELHSTNRWGEIGKENFLLYTMIFDRIGLVTMYFLMGLPFIASLVGGSLYGQEVRSNRNLFHLARLSKKTYVVSLSIASFILGGLASIVPLMINLVTAAFKMPSLQVELGNFSIYGEKFFAQNWAMVHPFSMIALVLGIYFIFGGLFALFSLSISYFYANQLIEILGVFIISFVSNLLLEIINLGNLHFYSFLDFIGVSETDDLFPLVIINAICWMLCILVIQYIESKRDVLQVKQKSLR